MRRDLSPVEIQRLADLHPVFAPDAKTVVAIMDAWCADKPYSVHVAQARRSRAEQAAIYEAALLRLPTEERARRRAAHLSAPGPVAPPGHSPHEHGLAIDVAFLTDAAPHIYVRADDQCWGAYGVEAERLGLVWGGRWPDPKTDRPHVELLEWRAYAGPSQDIG